MTIEYDKTEDIALVPQDDIDNLEKAREDLIKLFEHDKHMLIHISNITEKMWKITHRKYKKIIILDC